MNPRKEQHLKALSGTVRKDRLDLDAEPTFEAVKEVPKAPAWMKEQEAVAEWNRLAPILRNCRLLTEGNVGVLAQYCALHARLIKAWETPDSIPNASLLTNFRGLASDLGLLRMKLPPPKAAAGDGQAVPENRFARNGVPPVKAA